VPKPTVKKATARFQTQGRLLQELGERLVAKADVALMELIKNAYDADASECRVTFDANRVEIADDGHGMTEEEFLNNWMQIATPDKQRERRSWQYKRAVTGSKGIGRFAVRFLGRSLRLETVANVRGKEGERTLLCVTFDWQRIDRASQLHTVEIPYEVREAPPDRSPGTRLIIEKLRSPESIDFESIGFNKKLRTELLLLISPYSGLDTGWFTRKGESARDPGFRVELPGTSGKDQEDLASVVLESFYARVIIEHKDNQTKYLIRHGDGRVLVKRTHKRKRPSRISSGFFADIRYFPRRAGMFQGVSVDGRKAWGWVKEHGGVGIVDHGFRMRPYGFPDDDWLRLSSDSAHSRREWRVAFMNDLYPMPAGASSHPKLNPMLYLPKLHQMIGAVFVESSQDRTSERPTDLTPSMDREGFVENEAYLELLELVRAGLEMLAYADHSEQRRLEQERKEAEAKQLRADLRKAAQYIKTVPGLSATDRDVVVTQFTTLSKHLDDVEDYYQVATSKLELMGLLGVMAGFVTHEMQRVLNSMDRLLAKLRGAFSGDKEVAVLISEIEQTHSAIVGQLDYAAAFIGSLHGTGARREPISARAAVELAVDQFRKFIDDRGIEVDIQIDEGVVSPPLPRALYNGVAMNLITNSLKAVIGGTEAAPDPLIVIKSWNEPKWHILEVADTGVGIPPSLYKRIWDPLFTTTSGQEYNPLGSGMGLGLSLVKRVVADAGGRVDLVDPPPGFKTCFRVQFPR
jgi:signal transduction histidine kinase